MQTRMLRYAMLPKEVVANMKDGAAWDAAAGVAAAGATTAAAGAAGAAADDAPAGAGKVTDNMGTRTAAMLFFDLVGFTALSAELGPERVVALLDQCAQCCVPPRAPSLGRCVTARRAGAGAGCTFRLTRSF